MSDSGRVIGDCRHGHTPGWCAHCLRSDVERLTAENAELRGVVGRITCRAKITSHICLYCGLTFDSHGDVMGKIREHVEVCDKHPMAALKAENARLKADFTEQALATGREKGRADSLDALWRAATGKTLEQAEGHP